MRSIKISIWGWLLASSSLTGCCGKAEKLSAIQSFSDLELNATRYGLITAGAIRAARFDLAVLKELREKQIKAVDELAKVFATPPRPELSSAYLAISERLAALNLAYKRPPELEGTPTYEPQGPQPNSAIVGAMQSTLNDLFKAAAESASTEANRIDMARLRLGYIRYLDSQYDTLRLLETQPIPKDMIRLSLSVQLTAFVRGDQAKGAVVFFDLYPWRGDLWVHEAGHDLAKHISEVALRAEKEKTLQNEIGFWTEVGERFEPDWKKNLPILKKTFEGAESWPKPELANYVNRDPYGAIHGHLESQGLIPQIVHVEPLDEGELFDDLNLVGSFRRGSLSLGAILEKIIGGFTLASGRSKEELDRSQRVNPLSLAFTAGNSRAGWFLLPSIIPSGEGMMKPIERRIRMVVDVPKKLKRVALHVQKTFTDETLKPLPGGSFVTQMREYNHARHLISFAEDDFIHASVPYPLGTDSAYQGYKTPRRIKLGDEVTETDFRSVTGWELMKSRMRNLLYQGWSEALSFKVPEVELPGRLADQTGILEDDGERLSTVVLQGGKGFLPANLKFTLLVDDLQGKSVLNIRPVEIKVDALKDIVNIVFPTLESWGVPDGVWKTFGKIRLELDYAVGEGREVEESTFILHRVKKTPAKTLPFELIVSATQIVVTEDGNGRVGVILRLPKPPPGAPTPPAGAAPPPSMKAHLEVAGADFLAPLADVVVPNDGSEHFQELSMRNLEPGVTLRIVARNEKGAVVAEKELRVIRGEARKEKKEASP